MGRILVIDDDQALREIVLKVLRRRGYDVLAAESGAVGLELARTHLPDLVLSDVYMHPMDGYQTLAALRNEPLTATVPLILMTGIEEPAGIRRGMELGADDFLVKPFSAETLLATVEARLRKQEALRQQGEENRHRLVAILEATTDLVGIADSRTHHALYLNQAGRRLIGLEPTEAIPTLRLDDLHPPWALQRIRAEGIPAAIRDGSWTGETALLTRGGAEIPVSQVLLAHRAHDGSVEYLSTIARDVSERKQAEKERSMMEVQLRHAQKLEAIGQLAAGIAHEINTPTQYIGDNAAFLKEAFGHLNDLLRQYRRLYHAVRAGPVPTELIAELEQAQEQANVDYLAAEIPAAIAQTIEGVQRVARIVSAMKEFSHPGTEEKTAIDLNHAIESTLTVSRNEWKYVADVVTDFDPSLTEVPCLPGEFNQVILNLIINAAHTIAEVVGDCRQGKGTITIRTRRDGNWAEIRIRDTGSGIPEQIRDKIFVPFFTTKPVGKGTGQGLAIARSVVVDKHGGSITFETEGGLGTTFVVRLPLKLPEVAQSQAA